MQTELRLSGTINLEPLRFAEPEGERRYAWNGLHRSTVALVATGGPWTWLIEIPSPAFPHEYDGGDEAERATAEATPVYIPTLEVAERHTIRIGRSASSLEEAQATIVADWERRVRQLGIEPALFKTSLPNLARAEAFRSLGRCIKDPSQLRKNGLKDLEGVLRYEEARIARLNDTA